MSKLAPLIAISILSGLFVGFFVTNSMITPPPPDPKLDAKQLSNSKSRLQSVEGKAYKGLLDDQISTGLTTLQVNYPRDPIGPLIQKQWYWSNLKTPNDQPDGYAEVNGKFEFQNLQFPANTLP